MKFPVTRDPVHDLDLILLDVEEVLYMEVEERTVVFHTAKEKFYLLDTLSELAKRMGQLGFQKLDRINLVNLNKVTDFDEKTSKVYFNDEQGNRAKSTTVSYANRALMAEHMRLVRNTASGTRNL
ncbi:LytTR family DNA-binding domain-containing protein [Paenibacillus sp. HJGM_3]|uniref:LytTR family DNA-binding domain-containing protein n=1 Tax=Paenibacillus sp. HJGM_3 TaxID=3379816 RepID=UPI00385C772B